MEIPWPIIVQMAAPAGLEAIEFVVGLIQKAAKGTPPTSEDWRRLGAIYATNTAAQDLQQGIKRAGLT